MKKSCSGSLFSFAVVVLTALLAIPAQAATITVRSNADAGGTCPGATCTLRQAITTAAAGDTIDFYPGLSLITLASAELLITKNLTLNGPGANLLRLQRSAAAANHFRIFNVVGNTVTISNLTIASGLVGTDGAGIRHDGGTLNITNCASPVIQSTVLLAVSAAVSTIA